MLIGKRNRCTIEAIKEYVKSCLPVYPTPNTKQVAPSGGEACGVLASYT